MKKPSKKEKAVNDMDSGFHSIGLRIQNMDFLDQTIILARLAQSRVGSDRFTARDLTEIFSTSSLPKSTNIHGVLSRLRRKGLLTPGNKGTWSITPRGRQKSLDLLSDLDLAGFNAESSPSSALLGQVVHTVVPPSLAPPKLIPALRKFLNEHPFETNVFGMTRFPSNDPKGAVDPVHPALEVAREVCAKHGLKFHLASDRAMDPDLWTNVAAHMWASQYGIAFFENKKSTGMNYNLTIEVGGMLITGRRCALLKDQSIEKLPTDLVGHIYESVDLDKPETVRAALHKWLRDDLALGHCPDCPKKQ
jgi:hypothetical protein